MCSQPSQRIVAVQRQTWLDSRFPVRSAARGQPGLQPGVSRRRDLLATPVSRRCAHPLQSLAQPPRQPGCFSRRRWPLQSFIRGRLRCRWLGVPQRAVRCRGAGAVTRGPAASPLCFTTALGLLVQMGLSPDLPPAAELLPWQSIVWHVLKPLQGFAVFPRWPFPYRSHSWAVAT